MTNKSSVARQLDAALDAELERSFKMAKAIAPALDAIMDANARALPAYHRHTCDCGDYFVCTADRDCCPLDWTCPSCLERQMDEYWQGGGR